MARQDNVLSHRSLVVDGLSVCVSDFYSLLEELLALRAIPGASASRIYLSEGGLFGGKREYLRIRRGSQVFDLCYAPFGASAMVTWWLRRLPSRLWLKCLAGCLALHALLGLLSEGPGSVLLDLAGCFLMPVLMIGIAWFFLRSVPGMGCLWGAASGLAKLGWQAFRLPTLFQRDSDAAFQSAVPALVEHAVTALRSGQALRAQASMREAEALPGEELPA